MSRIVIALGGNALGSDYLEQQSLIKNTLLELVSLFKDNEIIITHGNGPQVGMITNAFNNDLPLDICTAMSEGYIGYHIQRELREVLEENKIDREVITVITEVLVDKNDPAFENPTKPIGKFYTKEDADKFMENSEDIYVQDANRGYRKVVASPNSLDIKNIKSIEALLSAGSIVVAVGGGGIPIIDDTDSTGVNAVIDKDYATSLLARKLNADLFVILTAVPQVMINFDSENPICLDRANIKKLREYIANDEFKKGSMLPKVEAAIRFTEATGKNTIITSIENAKNIKTLEGVTVIEK